MFNKTKVQIKKLENQTEKLKQMVETEREKVAGYEQIAKLHSAYIALLLQKLGATQENPFVITDFEVEKAMGREVRGCREPRNCSWMLYVEGTENR